MAPSKASAFDPLPALDSLRALLEEYDGEAGDLVAEIVSRAAHTAFAQPIRKIGALSNALGMAMSASMADSATLS